MKRIFLLLLVLPCVAATTYFDSLQGDGSGLTGVPINALALTNKDSRALTFASTVNATNGFGVGGTTVVNASAQHTGDGSLLTGVKRPVMGGGSGLSLASTTSNYFFCGPISSTSTAADLTNKACLFPSAVTVGGLYAFTSATISSGTNVVVGIWTNGLPTSITLNLNAGSSVIADNTHTESIPAGCKVTVVFYTNTNLASATYTWGYWIQ